MELYLAIFIDCNEREIISIHKSEKTAQKALDIHKAFKKKEYERQEIQFGKSEFGFEFEDNKYWVIHKNQLKD